MFNSNIKNILLSYPLVQETYKYFVNKIVDNGLKFAHLLAKPINSTLKNLILIQGLDPNMSPEANLIHQYQNLFDELNDNKLDYNNELDLSWAKKKFESLKHLGSMPEEGISFDEYKELTDLSNISKISPPEQDAELNVDKEYPLSLLEITEETIKADPTIKIMSPLKNKKLTTKSRAPKKAAATKKKISKKAK